MTRRTDWVDYLTATGLTGDELADRLGSAVLSGFSVVQVAEMSGLPVKTVTRLTAGVLS